MIASESSVTSRRSSYDQFFEQGPRGVRGAPLQVVQLVEAQVLAEALGQLDISRLPRPLARLFRKLANPFEERRRLKRHRPRIAFVHEQQFQHGRVRIDAR